MASNDELIRATFHVDLSSAYRNEKYWIRAHGRDLELHPHTAETRARARARSSHLAALPDVDLIHYTTVVNMTAGRAMRFPPQHSASPPAEMNPATAVTARKPAAWGTRVSVSVDPGGGGIYKKQQ